MIRKIGLLIAALCLALATAGSATATQTSPEHYDSNTWHDGGGVLYPGHNVSVYVAYDTQNDGVGIHVWQIQLTCSGPFESGTAVDGHYLRLYSQTGVLKWSKGDADSNIDGDCYRAYNVDIAMPNSSNATILYDFNANFDNQPDKDGSVGLTFYNNE